MISKKRSLLSLAIASTVTLTACGGSSGPSDPRVNVPVDEEKTDQELFCTTDSTVFAVTEFVPVDGATDVQLNSSARVTFNANIDPNSISGNLLLTQDGNPVVFTVAASGKSVVLDPMEDLTAGTDYVITAAEGLRADCGEYETEKYLGSEATAAFTTAGAGNLDTTPPTVTETSPLNAENLVATDSNILVAFDEAIDPGSVTDANFTVTKLDENGTPTETVAGVINPVGNSIEFDPTEDLNGQSYYSVTVSTGVTDLAGNGLESATTFTFRTGGLVVLLDDALISQIPVVGDALNDLGGALLSPLEIGEEQDGLAGLDNALLLQIPLLDTLTDAVADGLEGFEAPTTTTINEANFADFTSAAIAVCDPKSVTDATPAADCTVGLDLGLDLTQLATLADAFTNGDVSQVPELIQDIALALTNSDFDSLPSSLADILNANEIFALGDGLGVDLQVLDDDGLPVPAQLEEALGEVLNALGQIPVIGDLVDQNDGLALAGVGLLEGELLGVDLGGLAHVSVLGGTEQLIGENGVLNLGGSLFETLLLLLPSELGEGGSLSPEDLPLLGDLVTLLDLSNLQGLGLSDILMDALGSLSLTDGDLPLVGDLLSLLDPGSLEGIGAATALLEPVTELLSLSDGLNPADLPVVGELLSLLDPSELDEGELDTLAGLLEPLTSLLQLPSDGLPLDNLPLVGEILAQLDLTNLGNGDPLAILGEVLSLLDPSNLTDNEALAGIPVIGDLVGELTQALGGSELTDLPLLGDLLGLLQGGGDLIPETGTPLDQLAGLLDLSTLTDLLDAGNLTDVLNPDVLTSLPVLGEVLEGLLGGLLGGLASA